MASIATPLIAKIPQLRPLNIVRDLPGVADLVEKCFAATMDNEGRNYIQQMRRAGQDNAFLRWASKTVETASMPLSGFVWEENGEIIGNASLIPYHHKHKKFYLIANVAVRQDYRNRGIGRALTAAAMQHATHRHGDETWLQVRDDNPGAIGLYRSLGFVEHARRTAWQCQPDQNSKTLNNDIQVTRRTTRDWPIQETWLRRLYPDLLNWYQPMPWIALRPGPGPALYRFMSDYDVRHWVARDEGHPAAVVSWQALTGRNNRIWIAIPPKSSDELLTSLLLHTRCQPFMREKINLDFPAGQYEAAISAAGFNPYRTLLWMKSDETSVDEKRKSS